MRSGGLLLPIPPCGCRVLPALAPFFCGRYQTHLLTGATDSNAGAYPRQERTAVATQRLALCSSGFSIRCSAIRTWRPSALCLDWLALHHSLYLAVARLARMARAWSPVALVGIEPTYRRFTAVVQPSHQRHVVRFVPWMRSPAPLTLCGP